MSDAPIKAVWEGDGFKPASPYWQSKADEQFVVGVTYQISAIAGRSEQSHNHTFAVIVEAWHSLPDELLSTYPTAEFLRKRALVDIGHRNETLYACKSNAAALRLAAILRGMNQFAVIDVRDDTVRIWEARSMARNAVPDNKSWQDLKTRLLTRVGDIVGVSAEAMNKHDGAST